MSTNLHPNISLTDLRDGVSTNHGADSLRTSDLTFVGTTDRRTTVAANLMTLTPRELDVCVLHLIDGRTQSQTAAVLGIALRTVALSLESAIGKVPELEPLRTNFGRELPRPRVVHLSQLSRRDRQSMLFNADEL